MTNLIKLTVVNNYKIEQKIKPNGCLGDYFFKTSLLQKDYFTILQRI